MPYRRGNLIRAVKKAESTVKEDGKHKPYDDKDEELQDVVGKRGDLEGHCSIAYGHNLTINGIDEEMAEWLLKKDLKKHEHWVREELGDTWRKLDLARQDVLIELAFNVGFGDFLLFENMIAALHEGKYQVAADEMRDSDWYEQVGEQRGERMATQMENGFHEGVAENA